MIHDVSHKNIVTKGCGMPKKAKKNAKKKSTFSSKFVIIDLKGFENNILTNDNCFKYTFL